MAVKQSRPFDAFLDPTYTVSGARDHYKQGQAGGFIVQKVPEHANLFSELKHYQSSTYRIKADNALPGFVDRSFHPHQHVPQLLTWQSNQHQVNGPQLFKYFKQPHLAPGATITLPLRLAPQQAAPPPPVPPPEPLSKDAGTQSDYRESEAQTLPWSPDWVLPTDPAVLAKQAALCAKFNSSGPEVLQLTHLTFGNGLPGGLQEVRRLEKLRAKRAFEATLPTIDDVERLPERQAMIEAWEVQEWAEREDEIKGVQEERLTLLAQALQVREEEIEAAHREQLQKRSAALLAAKANRFAAIHSARVKTNRQLTAAKEKVTATLDRRGKSTIIEQYADYGSSLYAPTQREGHFPDVVKATTTGAASTTAGPAKHQQSPAAGELHPAMFNPNNMAALSELEASLPRNQLQPQLLKPKPQQTKLTYSQRAQAAVRQDVEAIHDMLQSAKAATGTRGLGQVWPFPLDDGPASAAALAAAAAAAAEGFAGSMRGLRSAGGASGAGSLAVAAAAAAAAGVGSTSGRPASFAKSAGGKTRSGVPTAPAACSVITEAPPLPDIDGQQAALVLLQRLLRGRAVQNQMYAGKQARLQLIRELRLGLEGTGGCQLRLEMRDAATQEVDAAIGGSLCRLCCLLASDDEEAIHQVLLSVAEQQQQKQQRPDVQMDVQLQLLTLDDHQDGRVALPASSSRQDGSRPESAAALQEQVQQPELQQAAVDQPEQQPEQPQKQEQEQQQEQQQHDPEASPADQFVEQPECTDLQDTAAGSMPQQMPEDEAVAMYVTNPAEAAGSNTASVVADDGQEGTGLTQGEDAGTGSSQAAVDDPGQELNEPELHAAERQESAAIEEYS